MATRAITPPPLQGPTAKEKKYDRQLRLWAASGQRALEDAHVLLLNTSPGVVGIETLKNLILPGIGSFTVVDEDLVSECDLGVNFFLTEESISQSRAQECCKFLQELNPEVNGHAIQKSVEDFVNQEDVLDHYSLILLVGPLRTLSVLSSISDYALQRSIPLFYIHSIGFYSHFSIQLPLQFPIVDTHPDPASTQDLRLLSPWAELLDFVRMKTQDLELLDDHKHGHIPYLILLIHYLSVWKASHKGIPPANYSEKKEFKSLVQSGARTNNAEGGEENYDEAVASVLKSLNAPSLPSGLREVFEANSCQKGELDTANFWIIAQAIKDFYSKNEALPLPGALPDMKAKSSDYIQLQNIYKTKARKDLAEVTEIVRTIEKATQRACAIEEKEIEAFCKGAAFIKLITSQIIRVPDEPGQIDWGSQAKLIHQELQDEGSLLPLHISFLAYDRGVEVLKIPPSGFLDESQKDALASYLSEYTNVFLNQVRNLDGNFDVEPCKEKFQSIIAELCGRARGAELHNISALTGGMVAQEVIKVITKQYIPIDNTCVFDGILSKTAVFKI